MSDAIPHKKWKKPEEWHSSTQAPQTHTWMHAQIHTVWASLEWVGWEDTIHICVLHLLSPLASIESVSLHPGWSLRKQKCHSPVLSPVMDSWQEVPITHESVSKYLPPTPTLSKKPQNLDLEQNWLCQGTWGCFIQMGWSSWELGKKARNVLSLSCWVYQLSVINSGIWRERWERSYSNHLLTGTENGICDQATLNLMTVVTGQQPREQGHSHFWNSISGTLLISRKSECVHKTQRWWETWFLWGCANSHLPVMKCIG